MALPKVVIDSAIWVTPSLSALPIELVSIQGTQIVPSDLKDANALLTRTVTRVDSNLLQDSPIAFVGTQVPEPIISIRDICQSEA